MMALVFINFKNFFKSHFQSQSLNVHIAEPNFGKLTSMHFYGWKLGLKTGTSRGI